MTGISRFTGELITEEEDIAESVGDILGTRIGSRNCRRDYGSDVPNLIDRPLDAKTVLQIYAATALAVTRWEDRIRLSRVSLAAGTTPGSAIITTEGVRTDTPVPTRVSIATSL